MRGTVRMRAAWSTFAGWEMPVQYGSIVDEHVATRTAVGVFDISHMGRLEFAGDRALSFLDRLVTRRVANMKPGQIRYSLITNEQGGILDDILVYHLQRRDGTPRIMMVVNASNRDKIVAWLQQHQRAAEQVTIRDLTMETAMIAVQGPACDRAGGSDGGRRFAGDEVLHRGAGSTGLGGSGDQSHGLHGRRRLRTDGAARGGRRDLAADPRPGSVAGSAPGGLGCPRHTAVGGRHAALRA